MLPRRRSSSCGWQVLTGHLKRLVAAVVTNGRVQFFGQAPRGSLEQKAIDLGQKLGVKNN